MTRLWDAVIAPRVEEAVLRASTMRSPVLGRSPVHLNLSHGQQALVKAALCILLNKAVLHGCPLPRPELDLYAKEFHGGHFNMSVISNHKSDSKKKGDGSSWRKASTTPRKKLKGLQSWNSQEKHNEDANPTMDFQKHCKKIMSMKQTNVDVHHPRVMDLKRTLSVDSDDDIDLIEELHSMCSSKSEPDISKIANASNDFLMVSDPQNGSMLSGKHENASSSVMLQQSGVCPPSSCEVTTSNKSRILNASSSVRVKSHLPVPLTKSKQHQNVIRRRINSSSNTRQNEINNNAEDI